MTTAFKTRRVNPVQLTEAVILSKAICPCEILPKGLPGLVRINGQTYTLVINATLPETGEPIVHGYRLTSTFSYKSYDLPADLSTCDCPDWTFRRNTIENPLCKHQMSCRKLNMAR